MVERKRSLALCRGHQTASKPGAVEVSDRTARFGEQLSKANTPEAKHRINRSIIFSPLVIGSFSEPLPACSEDDRKQVEKNRQQKRWKADIASEKKRNERGLSDVTVTRHIQNAVAVYRETLGKSVFWGGGGEKGSEEKSSHLVCLPGGSE